MKLTKAQQQRVIAALEKAFAFNPEKTSRNKAFGVVINASINEQTLKELVGEQEATKIASSVLTRLGYVSNKVTVKL